MLLGATTRLAVRVVCFQTNSGDRRTRRVSAAVTLYNSRTKAVLATSSATLPDGYYYGITVEGGQRAELGAPWHLWQIAPGAQSGCEPEHRSLNGEILARLTASVRSESVDPETILERIRLRHESIGQVDLSEDTLREMRNSGRP